MVVVTLQDVSHRALDAVDHFIEVGSRIAELEVMKSAGLRPATAALQDIANMLLNANEHMAGWLNDFTRFNFRTSDAASRFLALVAKYDTAKRGGKMRRMKASCGDIGIIYNDQIASRLDEIYPDDKDVGRVDVRAAFSELSGSDDDMVELMYNTVIGGIDEFIKDTEPLIDRSRLNSAEARRLRFRVDSADLSERLERLANGLSDLILTYARITGIPVTIDPPNRQNP
jgi:hypothetical protein